MSNWVDPDAAPPLTAEIAARAEVRDGAKVIRAAKGTVTRLGRPPHGSQPKRQVTLRLDADIIDYFRAGGPGWQSRINEVLRQAMMQSGKL